MNKYGKYFKNIQKIFKNPFQTLYILKNSCIIIHINF